MASSEISANAAQRDNWNNVAGPKWLRHEAALERHHAEIARLLFAAAAPAPGQDVLEIGCGTGSLLARWRDSVAPGGSVAGIDISATMLAQARERLPADVTLLLADAQQAVFEPAYDLLVSRFGVMFFADPVAAFGNLHGALRSGGRLCFVCWASLAENAHWREPMQVIERHVGPPEPSDPHAPGPCAFADLDRVASILAQAGFAGVAYRTEQVDLLSGSLDEAVTLATTLGPPGALIRERAPDDATLSAIRAEVAAVFAAWQLPDGMRLPAAVHLVSARA